MPTIDSTRQTTPRPSGLLEPPGERGVSAAAALVKGRLADAGKYVQAMSEIGALERAWKLAMAGRLAVARAEWGEAESSFLQAFALAHVACGDSPDSADGERLCSHMLSRVGWIHRRREHAAQALRFHKAAYDLAERSGSFEDLWEVATELGFDAEVVGDYAKSREWHLRALGFAEQCEVEPVRRQAAACTNLSQMLLREGATADAAAAASRALDLWRKFDTGAIAVSKAEHRLGVCWLRHAETLLGEQPEAARGVLDDATRCLAAAHEALLAFGPDGAVDAESCTETIDFAARLRMSLDT